MAATITREQLAKLLEGIATKHWQIHTYGWGDVPDLLAREDVIYPFLMVTPQSSVYGDNTINHTYTLSIADRVLKNKENEVTVDSDTHQLLMDVVTQLDNLLYDDVDLVKGVTVTPFFDNFRHEVTGHFANVTVQVMYNYDACAIPSDNVDLPIPPPDVCLPASYRVQYVDGTLIEEGTIPSGGSVVVDVPLCEDATYELRDSAGVLIESGSIASGGSATITAPDGVVTITDSAATTLYVVNVKSDGPANQVIADSVVTLNNTAAALLSTTNVRAEDPATIVAPDGSITVNSVAFSSVESGGTENVQVRKSSGSDLIGSKQGQHWRVGDSVITNDATVPTYTQSVKATEGLVLPTQSIEVNDVVEGSINSVGTIDINITDGVNPVVPNSVGIVGRTVTVEVPSGTPPPPFDPEAFVLEVKTDIIGVSNNNQFTITGGTSSLFDVKTSDGQTFVAQTGTLVITFPSPDIYLVEIKGEINALSNEKNKILRILNWGTTIIEIQQLLIGSLNMQVVAEDLPNFKADNNSGLNAFNNRIPFSKSIENWVLPANMISSSGMFQNNAALVNDLSGWDVSNISNMASMLTSTGINKNLGSWNLRLAGVNLQNIFNNTQMSTANYTDTIVGWANYVFDNAATPSGVNMSSQFGRTFDTSRSGGVNFANAGAARTYLTTTASWTIANDTVI